MRDVKKQAAQGRKILETRPNLDLTAGELNQIFETFNQEAKEKGINEGVWEAISDAFYMGLAVGIRNGKKARA